MGKLKLRVGPLIEIGVTLLLQNAGDGGGNEAAMAGDGDFALASSAQH